MFSFLCFLHSYLVSPLGSIKTSPDVFASVGDTAELVCSAKGGPDNQFEWKHLPSNQTFPSGPNLTISSITVYKGGDYQCIALNAAGFDKGTTSVNGKLCTIICIHFLPVQSYSTATIIV